MGLGEFIHIYWKILLVGARILVTSLGGESFLSEFWW